MSSLKMNETRYLLLFLLFLKKVLLFFVQLFCKVYIKAKQRVLEDIVVYLTTKKLLKIFGLMTLCTKNLSENRYLKLYSGQDFKR